MKRTAADARFSLQIRQRDNFTCQKCGAVHDPKSKGLHLHHIWTRSIQRVRFDPDNATSLCYACHMRAHQYQEDTRSWWRSVLGDDRFDALAARAHGKRDR